MARSHDWDALLKEAAARGLGVCALARELGHESPALVSRKNALAGSPLPRNEPYRAPFTHPHKPVFVCPSEWGLTGQQAQFVAVLVDAEGDVLARDLLRKIAPRGVKPKLVDVLLCHVRQKLSRFGIRIRRDWGKGNFYIDAETKEALRAGATALPFRTAPKVERAA